MKKKLLLGTCALAVVCAGSLSAQAQSIYSDQTIGAQFTSGAPQPPSNGGNDTNTGALGETFVSYTAPFTTTDTASTASMLLGDGVTLSLSTLAGTPNNGSIGYGEPNGYAPAPFIGVIQASIYGTTATNPTTITFTFSGLEAGATYNVAAYDGDSAAQAFSFDGGTTFQPVAGTGAYDYAFEPGTNYTAATDVVASSTGTLSIIDEGAAPTDGGTSPTYYAITEGVGIQFVADPAVTATPEPSTWALMAIGLGFLGFIRFNRARLNS